MDHNTVTLTTTLPFSHNLPPELWDQVIDALAENRDASTQALPEAIDYALKNCALVCRNWLPRAKLHLRHVISIDDVNSLTGLAQRMSATSSTLFPHVSYLALHFPSDGHYPPSNVLTLLPILFRLGISSIYQLNLQVSIHPSGQLQPQETEQKTVLFPYLPLHPRFPNPFTPVFSTVRVLHMSHMTFKNFSDFGKFLNCFSRLEELDCQKVRWLTLGVVPGCMSRKNSPTFLQNLHHLEVRAHRPVCIFHARTDTSRISASSHKPLWYQQDSRRSP